MRAFAAMSMDGGATFGPAQQIDPDRAGNQFNPRLAATAGGRVDVAYLWDPAGTGRRDRDHGLGSGTAAGCDYPAEAWGNPVIGPGRRHLDGTRSSAASASRRPARSARCRRPSWPSPTRHREPGRARRRPARTARPRRSSTARRRVTAPRTSSRSCTSGHRRRRRSAHVVGRVRSLATRARA